jgi:hypothetical protein
MDAAIEGMTVEGQQGTLPFHPAAGRLFSFLEAKSPILWMAPQDRKSCHTGTGSLNFLFSFLSRLAKEIGKAHKTAKGVHSPVSRSETAIGDVFVHEFAVEGPVVFKKVTDPHAGLGGELNGLTDRVLRLVFVDVIIDRARADLHVRNRPPTRLEEVIPDQRCQPRQIVSGALVNGGFGEFKNCFEGARQERWFRIRII